VYDTDATVAPQYVVYSEVVHGAKRPYMRGVSAIEAEWLAPLAAGTPLCRHDRPLDTPAPRYDAPDDRVVCWVVPTFGDRAWKLPAFKVPYPSASSDDRDMRLRVFARGFLEGAVVPQLKHFVQVLSAPPSSVTKRAPQRRVALLLDALTKPPGQRGARGGAACIESASALAAVWARYPLYLSVEYKGWLPASYHDSLDKAWAAMVAAFVRAHSGAA
jgi:ATP-dependent RNA helicase DHX37/DHR1